MAPGGAALPSPAGGRAEPAQGAPVLEVRDLVARYGQITALEEKVALLSQNGRRPAERRIRGPKKKK